MMKKMTFGAVLALFSLASGTAWAVELPQPVIPLFNETLMTNYAGIDWVGNPGIEAPGTNKSVEVIPLSDPAKVRSRVNFKLRVKDPANNASLGAFDAYVDTRPYPNPDTVAGTSYYCEDGGQVRSADPTGEPFPCDYDLNAGIANSGVARYLVMSLAAYAYYVNSTDGYVDIGRANVFVWDPATRAELWHKSWPVKYNNWEIVDGLSAVGDFLGSDGNDEARIAYWREGADNAVVMKYTYFDIVTGQEIPNSKQTFIVPSP
jgi:hypothetical protein